MSLATVTDIESNGSSPIWKDPPARTRTGGRKPKWRALLVPLLDNPGRWAMVKECETPQRAANCVQNLRRKMVTVPDGDWLFVSRGNEVFACSVVGLDEGQQAKLLAAID